MHLQIRDYECNCIWYSFVVVYIQSAKTALVPSTEVRQGEDGVSEFEGKMSHIYHRPEDKWFEQTPESVPGERVQI